MVAGLTGLCCAGKNYLARFIEARGIPVLDADAAAHEALELPSIKEEIERIFGSGVMSEAGTVNRRALGALVFADEAARERLESITHPAINAQTEQWVARMEAAGAPLCVVNAPLLHKSSVFPRLAAVIVVTAPYPLRLYRALRRDRLPISFVLRRFASQRTFPSQFLPENADIYRIDNGFLASPRHLEKEVGAALDFLEGKEQWNGKNYCSYRSQSASSS